MIEVRLHFADDGGAALEREGFIDLGQDSPAETHIDHRAANGDNLSRAILPRFAGRNPC